MKNQLKKELKKININSQSLFKSPLKILKKINLDKLKKVTSFSLTEEYKEFKKKRKQKKKEKREKQKKEKKKKKKQKKKKKKKKGNRKKKIRVNCLKKKKLKN